MAEICLLSNQSSSLYASSKASGGADKSSYIYDMKQSSVNKFTEKFIKTTINNAQFGGTCNCSIASFGVLRQMVLHTQISYKLNTAQAPVFARGLFAELIDQVSIKNSSREIQVLYGDCIKNLVYNLGNERGKKWKILGKDNLPCGDVNALSDSMTASSGNVRYQGLVKTTTTGAGVFHTLDVYTILPFSMFEGFGSSSQSKNLFNTRFLEKLSLEVKYNPRIKAMTASANVGGAGGFDIEPTISKCELIQAFDIIQDKELQAIESANYSLSQPLAMVLGNWNKTRSTFLTTSASTDAEPSKFEIQLFNTDLAHSILIVCRKINTIAHYHKLGTALNLKTCDSNNGNETCEALAGFTRGAGTLLTAERAVARGQFVAQHATLDAIVGFQGGNPASKYTGKDCIPHNSAHAGYASLADGQGCSRQGADYQKLSSIEITSAGRSIYKADTHEEALYLTNTEMKGSCWFDDDNGKVGEDADLQDQNGASPYNMYLIPFGDDETTDSIRGMLSMKNLNSVKVAVEMPNAVAGATYEVCVYIRKYSALSIESNSGRVSVAVST